MEKTKMPPLMLFIAIYAIAMGTLAPVAKPYAKVPRQEVA